MNVERYCLFPSIATYAYCDNYSEIKDDLINWIYSYQKKNPETENKSNRGGWQSSDLFYRNEKSFSRFYNYIESSIHSALSHHTVKFRMNNMWININRKNNHNTAHQHPHSHVSGVFWVKTPENCGDIVFESPHYFDQYINIFTLNSDFSNNTNCSFNYTFYAREGNMLLFPSPLRHWVQENTSDEDRISISFNLDNF